MSAEDTAWVFDSLVGFLQGPIWNSPILTFIEEKSQIFEPNSCTENECHYKEIHDEYKDLVDTILGTYMEDMVITPEQFAVACSQNFAEGSAIKFHQSLFEQVWAANDLDIFRQMMIQKNVELQLQALEMIQQRYGITPASFLPGTADDQPDEDARVMEQVIKKSLEEYEASKLQLDFSTLQIEQSLVASKEEHDRLEAECKREKEILHSVLQQTKEFHLASLASSSTITKSTTASASSPRLLANEMTRIQPSSVSQIDAGELAKRQEYLKMQRDKLLAMKKAEREKQLIAVEEESPHPSKHSVVETKTQTAQDTAKTLQVRKALADRLKAEVMGRI